MIVRSLFFFLLVWALPGFAQEETLLLRFPTIHEDKVIFSYAGDLYTVGSTGGMARRLTTHEGYEMFPRFSPDGETVAFTAQYDGNTEVFTMPAQGGSPKRLTITSTLGRDDISDRMGPNNIVMAWKNSGDGIAFRSRLKSYNSFNGQLFVVSPEGGLPEQLPVPRGGFLSFSPDDSKMAYNRIFREFRTWKRYRGGMADDIWIYDFAARTVRNITDNPAQDIIPMWHGESIYFLSDRTGRLNLFVYELGSGNTRRLTDYSDFDIKFPSLGPGAVVFEHAGGLHRLDLATERVAAIPVRISEDFAHSRGGLAEVGRMVSNYEIAPDGKRALFGARGDVFTVPVKNGETRNLTATPGVHERAARWSPDGRWIAYISDQTGEDEIYVIAQDGSGEPIQLTSGSSNYIRTLRWAPDSGKLLFNNRAQALLMVDVAGKAVSEVARSEVFAINQYAWSPDSKWVAYTFPEPDVQSRVYLYSLESGESFPATSSWYTSGAPAFSDDGRFLFVTSNRDFRPSYSWTEWNHAYFDMERIYMIALNKDVKSPFAPKSDEVAIKADEKAEKKTEKKAEKKPRAKGRKGGKAKPADEAGDKGKKDEGVTVRVERDGLLDRIIALPVEPSNYNGLASAGNSLYYNRNGMSDERTVLLVYDLDKQKETELGNFGSFRLSHDNKKMIVPERSSRYAIINAPKGKIKIKDRLDLSGMEMVLDLNEEWRQIFHQSWRAVRDFFYAPNLHGVDWAGTREQYEPLLEHVRHRNDLNYVIGEMISELNAGHAYVGGGERPRLERIPLGHLGAELSRDNSGGGYWRIDRILPGQNWERNQRSPLTEVGVRAAEGNYILAVNGAATNTMDNIYAALINTVGKQVTLRLSTAADGADAWETVVRPIANESQLYYLDWVRTNIEKVNRATDGKVGYLHIPDMGPGGLNEFVKYYYPQLTKKALIVDVRGNGGGNVSPHIIERLRRELAMVSKRRNAVPTTNPGGMILGPMVCLMDEFSASDGDIFPYRFKKMGMGPLIGKRSWGGVVGIRGSIPFVDGGDLRVPEFALYDTAGREWVIEGYGVDPDIVVDNDPAQEFAGVDQQLNKAIEVILEKLQTEGRELPDPPPYPDKR
ncbi:MAG: S41 family peptidase [Acidobacteriota bacterium]|nr:S41 family peptidase [Acidobacteriota bacterium]